MGSNRSDATMLTAALNGLSFWLVCRRPGLGLQRLR
jgi:hypothetical protein